MTHEQIIRAWKDEDYRLGLSGEQLSALPAHPAGLVELSDESLLGVAGMNEEGPILNIIVRLILASIQYCHLISKAVCGAAAPPAE